MPQIRFRNSNSQTKPEESQGTQAATQSAVIDVSTPNQNISDNEKGMLSNEELNKQVSMDTDSPIKRNGLSGSTLDMPDATIPMQFQDDFNWDELSEEGSADGDSEDNDRSEPKRPNRFMRLHPLLRSFIIMICGGIILILPTAIVLGTHRDLPFRARIPKTATDYQHLYDLQCVARSFALLSSIWVFGVLAYHLIDMIPDGMLRIVRLFTGKRYIEKLKDRMQFFIAIKPYIKMVVISSISLVSFVIMFPNSSYRIAGKIDKTDSSWDQVLFQINVLLLFACGIIGIEKLILKVIATRFHRTAYKERIEAQTYASWVLDKLNRSREVPATNTPSMGNYDGFTSASFYNNQDTSMSQKELLGAHADGQKQTIDENATPPPLRKNNTSSSTGTARSSVSSMFGRSKQNKSFINKLWSIKDRALDGGVDMNSNQYATRLARKLFNALTNERDYLVVDDFLPFFSKEEEAIKAFEFFDKDSNGDISKKEMRDRVLFIYKERRAIISALSDMSQVVGKLDLFMTCFAVVVIIIVALLVFGLDALKSLATMGTLFVGWSFVFGSTFKNIFECVIFLFQVHPFDAGDTVVIATEYLTVYKIRLLSTVFFKTDGTYTVYQNNLLAAMKIQNMRRSHAQFESIPVSFDLYTPVEKLYELRDRMNAYIDEHPRDLIAPVGFSVDVLENANRIQISVGINHKSNWQDGGKRWSVRNDFAFALKQAITDLNLRYAMPVQPVSMVGPHAYGDFNSHEDSDRRSVSSTSTSSSLSLRRANTNDYMEGWYSSRTHANTAARGASSGPSDGPGPSANSGADMNAGAAGLVMFSNM